MKKSFLCSCGTHLIEIEYNSVMEFINTKTKKKYKSNIPELWIGIYNIYNPNTGRKYRKPKLIGDVEFLGSDNYAKEMDFIMEFLEDITMSNILRKK